MIFGYIIVAVLMLLGCFFINDTRAKHGVCCGKACPGCKVFEKRRQEELNKNNK